jgi:GH24 family phage-related lysozyme (muramidase)
MSEWYLSNDIQAELSTEWFDKPEIVAELQLDPDMIRQDFTMKSNQGYLGQVKDNKGYTMTEQSIDVDIDGKKVLMPLLVPGLNNEEINAIKAGEEDTPAIKSAEDKAIEHGKQRIKEGKSPFFEDKPQSITLDPDEVPIGNMGKGESEMIADYIADYEGFKDKAYQLEGEEHYTIGYGHYGKDVAKDQRITKDEAKDLLIKDVESRTKELQTAFKDYDKYSLDMKKNLASSWFRGSLIQSKKTRKLINEGKFKEAADEFLDNQEYRTAKEKNKEGIRKRMEATANALRNYVPN